MRISIILIVIGVSAAVGLAQQPPEGPVTNYSGYAHQDCGASKWPDEPVRATFVIGRFVAAWREVTTKCG